MSSEKSFNSNEALQKMDQFLASEAGKKFLEKHFADQKIMQDNTERRVEQLHRFIIATPQDQLLNILNKFISWETAYEEYEYTVNHCISWSNLFGLLVQTFEMKGKDREDIQEDFLSSAMEYQGYILKIYMGQGSFCRLITIDGTEIFQTT